MRRKHYTVKARDCILNLGTQTSVMSIINMTPDSFSQDGLWKAGNRSLQKAVRKGMKAMRDGANILDIGGESTRPGSRAIGVKEEIQRTIPIIRHLAQKMTIPISIDTYKSTVAKHALDAGASIVNNIMGTKIDPSLLKMVRQYGAAIVLMHIQGKPRTMQKNIAYKDLMKDIFKSLQKSIEICLEIGIKSDKIIIDPGIGFGKTAKHNLEIINRLSELRSLKCPILMGTSRKSFIGRTLGRDVAQRLMGTAASVCASIMNGAHIVRVHDTKHMSDIVRMTDAIINERMTTV